MTYKITKCILWVGVFYTKVMSLSYANIQISRSYAHTLSHTHTHTHTSQDLRYNIKVSFQDHFLASAIICVGNLRNSI